MTRVFGKGSEDKAIHIAKDQELPHFTRGHRCINNYRISGIRFQSK